MAYERLNLNNGDILTAEHIEHLEDGIENANNGNSPSARIAYVNLLANKWNGTQSPYSQVVEVEGVTAHSQVDLTPSVAQLATFYDKSLAFVTENDSGVVTVYAIGQKPANDYTIQVTITEVTV